MLNKIFSRVSSYFKQESERGDVPGWVMIVIMTAGLVVLIWALAGEALTTVFETAISRILGV